MAERNVPNHQRKTPTDHLLSQFVSSQICWKDPHKGDRIGITASSPTFGAAVKSLSLLFVGQYAGYAYYNHGISIESVKYPGLMTGPSIDCPSVPELCLEVDCAHAMPNPPITPQTSFRIYINGACVSLYAQTPLGGRGIYFVVRDSE